MGLPFWDKECALYHPIDATRFDVTLQCDVYGFGTPMPPYLCSDAPPLSPDASLMYVRFPIPGRCKKCAERKANETDTFRRMAEGSKT